MPLDAICIAAVRDELSESIIGLKIDKVQQPERDIVVLALRGHGAPRRLLISAGTGDARVHLTEHRFDNPASPPMFCMLLRKHLTGARITGLSQPQSERVLELALEAPDAMGLISEKRLVIELVGRMSNIILLDSGGIIIDCLRRIGDGTSEKRAVLPGLYYHMPPAQEGKHDPLSIGEGEWQELFNQSTGKSAEKWLLSTFIALSPLICREISWRAYGEADFLLASVRDGGAALRREFFALMDAAKEGQFGPWSVSGANDTVKDFSYTKIMQYEGALGAKRGESFSDMLDGFYTRTAQLERIRQRVSAMSKTIKTARDRLVRKLAAQQAELKKTSERESWRECGDIITANMHLIKKGQTRLNALDFYSDEGGEREIALDPQKTPQQNAARYYKEYTKAKNAEKYLTEQIQRGESELEYLESVLEEIGLAENEKDLLDIRGELTSTGYIKARKQGKEKQQESAPMRFISSTGVPILAGRNNTQNDKLTLKTAMRADVWLHAQKIHGSHVIIQHNNSQAPDETTLNEAAVIAAYYSSARAGGKVPVDYTLVKYVKKQPGGRPGMVLYTDYKTILASPDEGLVGKLRAE